jgi:hypothetical protein
MLNRLTAAAVALAGMVAVASAQTTINFDDVADQADVRTHYQPQGVTFSCAGTPCADPAIANGVYARTTSGTPSAPNGVSPIKTGFPGVSDTRTGRVIAAFSSPVKTVSVDARSTLVPEPLNQTAFANLIAFDANGAEVARATGTQLNVFEKLTVSAPDDRIARVSLGVSGQVAIAAFDNLQFGRDATMGMLFWVPIFIIILIVVYLFFRRKKDQPRPPAG